MSGLVMIQGQLAGAMTRLQSAQVVSAGRGEITEQFSDGMFHLIYQGLSPGSEFFRDSDWVCCVLGWPYEMRSNIAVALNAEMIAFRFAQQQILDRNCLFGQYLIVIYSRRNQTLWVLRDTLGGLPLHWSANSNFGVHASDIRQIYAVLGSDPILQLAALKDYHQNLTLRNETALYHDAFQHLPGEFSICDGKNFRPRSLVSAPNLEELTPNFGTRVASSELSQEEVRTAVKTSVQMCVRDRAFAMSLSGGMDSALIALSVEALGLSSRCRAISCIFPRRACDESAQIECLSKALTMSHEYVHMAEPHFDHWQTQLFSATDYVPFPANQIVLNIAQRAATRDLTVLIDGNGGDELFDWNELQLAQCVRSCAGVAQVLQSVLRSPNRLGLLAIRHLLKRFLLGAWPNPSNSIQPVAQKMVSASRNRAFYLAREQVCANQAVQVYSPFRDSRLIQLFCPYLPQMSFTKGQRRALQSRLIAELSGGKICLERKNKVSFDELTLLSETDGAKSAIMRELPDLGTAKFQQYSQLLPRFFRHKVEIERVSWR